MFRKSDDERGERSKSPISPRVEKGSPSRMDSVSPPNTSDDDSCCEAAVTVDDVDVGDDTATSWAEVHVLGCGCSTVCAEGGTWVGSMFAFEGLLPVTGLHTPELSSGQRKTSMGPLVLFSDTW